MSWMDQIGNILQEYTGGGGTAVQSQNVHEHLDQVAQAAPQSVLAGGLAESFRSDQTASFSEMVASLFRQSDGQQRAGILSRLLGAVGPAASSQVPGVSGLANGGQQITAQQAQQISPEAVQQLATQAQQKNPSIVDEVSGFYAQHPDVVKALGGLAL